SLPLPREGPFHELLDALPRRGGRKLANVVEELLDASALAERRLVHRRASGSATATPARRATPLRMRDAVGVATKKTANGLRRALCGAQVAPAFERRSHDALARSASPALRAP